MSWTVGKVDTHRRNELGHGFSILNQHRAPLLTLTYKTVEEADLARSVVEAVLSGAIDVISHPDPSRL